MTNAQLEKCIEDYGTDLYSFCRHLTCNSTEADDLYQDTFLKAVELGEKIEYDSNPKSYLLSIALRIWKNRKRKYAWRKRITEEKVLTAEAESQAEEVLEASPEEKLITHEINLLVRKAVEKLPKRQKIIVLLYYMEELTVTEIAAVVKIPAGTVKSRLYQARKSLEKELEDVLDEKRHG